MGARGQINPATLNMNIDDRRFSGDYYTGVAATTAPIPPHSSNKLRNVVSHRTSTRKSKTGDGSSILEEPSAQSINFNLNQTGGQTELSGRHRDNSTTTFEHVTHDLSRGQPAKTARVVRERRDSLE